MKIEVVTVYNSYNFGSYLQAKGLNDVLSEYGQVKFLDVHQRKMFRPCLSRILRGVRASKNLKQAVSVVAFELREFFILKKSWKGLKTTKSREYGDVFVLGSDEIWNIKRGPLKDPVYWGGGISGWKIAYAPSINNSTVEDFDAALTRERLKDIDCISVRDWYSKKVLENFCDDKITTVLDPTLLKDPEQTDSWPVGKPYIAVYIFDKRIQPENIQKIVAFARTHGLALVSAGLNHPWCDYSVNSLGGNAYWIYKNAEMVITNTFHGTAFAINYRKKFVTFAKDNLKINELLSAFHLEEFAYDGISPEKQFNMEFPRRSVEDLLGKYRRESLQYIRTALSGDGHIDSSLARRAGQ